MFKAWADLTMLAWESQQVIALRMVRLASGGSKATEEMQRITTEKIEALAHESGRMFLGATNASVVKRYRQRVRANRRRLSR